MVHHSWEKQSLSLYSVDSTHLFAGSSQIKYVLRSRVVCRCSVSCANIYSIPSHPTWHMCASSLGMRCRAMIAQSNLRLWKFTAFFTFFLRFGWGSTMVFTFRQCKFAEIYSGNHALLCAECLSFISDTHFSFECVSMRVVTVAEQLRGQRHNKKKSLIVADDVVVAVN